MKRSIAIVALLIFVGCAHVATTKGTLNWGREKDFTLRVTRHVDTVVRGPDDEEDQVLELHVRQWRIGEPQRIPEDVPATFTVQRFGPASRGESFHGGIVVKSVSEKKVVANVNLVVTARTADNSYKQTARFRGDYTFTRD